MPLLQHTLSNLSKKYAVSNLSKKYAEAGKKRENQAYVLLNVLKGL